MSTPGRPDKQAYERAFQRAKLAFALLEKHGIQPSPENVMATYAYASKEFPKLNSKLDQIFGSEAFLMREKWDEVVCHFFFKSGNCARVLDDVDKLADAMSGIMGSLARVEGETINFAGSLSQSASLLEESEVPPALRATVEDLVVRTNVMAERYQEVQRELEEKYEEVGILKKTIDEVHRARITDELTDLFNRRYCDARLRELAEEATWTARDLSLLLIEVDDYEGFISRHGDTAGAEVLKLVARIIKNAVRDMDVPARWDERVFGIVLPRTNRANAKKLADRIHKTIGSRPLFNRVTKQNLGTMTVSIGGAGHPPGGSVDKTRDAAQESLRIARQAGRNRVIIEGVVSTAAS